MAITLIVFFGRNKYKVLYKKHIEWGIVGSFMIVIISISVYCINHLPILDFRPYNIGTYIPEKMEIPENAPRDEYEIKVYYQKEGIEKEFTLDNLPDSTWEFVKTENRLIKQGFIPPIHDFTIDDFETGEDIADIVLNDDVYTFIAIHYDIDKSSIKNQQKLNELAIYCAANGHNFIGLTSSLTDVIDAYEQENYIPYQFFNTDEITLKTIIRSNPGLILLKKGVIVDKWHHNDIPELKEFEKNILASSINNINNKKENLLSLLFMSIFCIGILLFHFFYKIVVGKSK